MIKAKNLDTGNFDVLPNDVFRNPSYGVIVDYDSDTFPFNGNIYDNSSIIDTLKDSVPEDSSESVNIRFAGKKELENGDTYIGFINPKTGLYKIMFFKTDEQTGELQSLFPNGDDSPIYQWRSKESYTYLIKPEL